MKYFPRISLAIVFLSISFITLGQGNNNQTNNFSEKEFFTGKTGSHIIGSDTFTIYNASLTSKMMIISNAGKILYDTTTKTLLAYEVNEFTFAGKVIVAPDVIGPRVLQYTIGDDKAFIK